MPGRPTLGMQQARRDLLLGRRVTTIRDLLARRASEIARRDERIQKLRRPADARVARLEERLTDQLLKLFALCQDRWTELAGAARSFTVEGMTVWRELKEARVGFDAKKQAELIAELRRLGLDDCVTTVEVIDLEALTAHLDEVMGLDGVIYMPPDESFGVRPSRGGGWTGRVSELTAALAKRTPRPRGKVSK